MQRGSTEQNSCGCLDPLTQPSHYSEIKEIIQHGNALSIETHATVRSVRRGTWPEGTDTRGKQHPVWWKVSAGHAEYGDHKATWPYFWKKRWVKIMPKSPCILCWHLGTNGSLRIKNGRNPEKWSHCGWEKYFTFSKRCKIDFVLKKIYFSTAKYWKQQYGVLAR